MDARPHRQYSLLSFTVGPDFRTIIAQGNKVIPVAFAPGESTQELTIVPLSSNYAQAIIPHFKECGYRDKRLATPFRLDNTDIDVVGFAGKPWDSWSACLAAVELSGDTKSSATKVASLGVTSVFVCGSQGIDWWGLGTNGPTNSKPIRWNQLEGFFREHRAELVPQAIYNAKLRRPSATANQLTFFDIGLMSAVEKERGETLLRVVRRGIDYFHDKLDTRIKSEQDWEHVYRAVFWLLTAKVLNDKHVPNFQSISLSDVKDVFGRIGRHHGVTDSLPPFGIMGLAAMERFAEQLNSMGSLADVSSESIAYLYEHALIDKATHEGQTNGVPNSLSVRRRRGIHGTPSVLRDHILAQLWPLIEEIKPGDRKVLEPACGHAPFLTGMLRWLREWDANGEPVRTHEFLRDRLVGLDDYAFARELAKLNLTIADAEHRNAWTIREGDMFAPGVLRHTATNAHILLSNPPYESFARVGAKRYLDTDEPVTAETQGVEMLRRTLPNLPPGGVFGVVMPVGVLHDRESEPVRRELLRDFDLSEINVFADSLFEHGAHEVAVLMGRKKKARAKSPTLMYRRVREAGMKAFKERLEFSWAREVSQSRFGQYSNADLRLTELDEIWSYLSRRSTLDDYATIGQGLFHRSGALPPNAWTIRDPPRESDTVGFANVTDAMTIFGLPRIVGVNLSPAVVDRLVAGAPTGTPQVLLNYAPVSRLPWKLKATLDPQGRALTNRFSAIRARNGGPSTLYLWAVLNSPVANAFAYDKLGKRDILIGTMRTMPVPPRSPSNDTAIEDCASRYRALALAKAESKPARSNLFASSGPQAFPIPTEAEVRTALLAMDAAVLRAYDLPPRLERQLLDLFNGVERKGVGLDGLDGRSTFRGYYPPGFTSAIPLHVIISDRFDRAAADKTMRRFKPGESRYVREVLNTAAAGTDRL